MTPTTHVRTRAASVATTVIADARLATQSGIPTSGTLSKPLADATQTASNGPAKMYQAGKAGAETALNLMKAHASFDGSGMNPKKRNTDAHLTRSTIVIDSDQYFKLI